MGRKSVIEPRRTERRVRQVYHDLERRRGNDRRAAVREVVIKDRGEGLGMLGWLIIAVIGLYLTDTFAWHSYYQRSFWRQLDAEASATRDWSDHVWL